MSHIPVPPLSSLPGPTHEPVPVPVPATFFFVFLNAFFILRFSSFFVVHVYRNHAQIARSTVTASVRASFSLWAETSPCSLWFACRLHQRLRDLQYTWNEMNKWVKIAAFMCLFCLLLYRHVCTYLYTCRIGFLCFFFYWIDCTMHSLVGAHGILPELVYMVMWATVFTSFCWLGVAMPNKDELHLPL